MNIHLREGFAHHHDQTGIGHDQSIWAHIDHWLQIVQKGFELGIMRGNIHHHVKFLAQRMGFIDTLRQVFMAELVVVYS